MDGRTDKKYTQRQPKRQALRQRQRHQQRDREGSRVREAFGPDMSARRGAVQEDDFKRRAMEAYKAKGKGATVQVRFSRFPFPLHHSMLPYTAKQRTLFLSLSLSLPWIRRPRRS